MELTDRQKKLINISILTRMDELSYLNANYKFNTYTPVMKEYKEILKQLKVGKQNE